MLQIYEYLPVDATLGGLSFTEIKRIVFVVPEKVWIKISTSFHFLRKLTAGYD